MPNKDLIGYLLKVTKDNDIKSVNKIACNGDIKNQSIQTREILSAMSNRNNTSYIISDKNEDEAFGSIITVRFSFEDKRYTDPVRLSIYKDSSIFGLIGLKCIGSPGVN